MNTEKFTGKAVTYEKYRPGYPDEFIRYLYNQKGFSQSSCIADIGAGTGILTGLLLEQGSFVFGVEPNNDMRNLLETKLAAYKNFSSVNGTAENTRLKNQSVDYITVAQAFHWFDALVFKKECQRILKPDGLVVLVWNSRVAQSELVIENAIICRKLCPNFIGFTGGEDENPSNFEAFFKDSVYESESFENNISYDLDRFIGRNLSASYAPKERDTIFNEFISEITDLFNRYSSKGKIVIPNVTRCYTGKV